MNTTPDLEEKVREAVSRAVADFSVDLSKPVDTDFRPYVYRYSGLPPSKEVSLAILAAIRDLRKEQGVHQWPPHWEDVPEEPLSGAAAYADRARRGLTIRQEADRLRITPAEVREREKSR